ncbi:hypothetical protein HX089_11465 [Myroides odoratimimus]|uniref:DUF5689 domain-containing protein n=2 Tax=Myroides odoratimimus TaxID=76832 RepID=UPI002577CFE5|nr:DUF5689 domain-containing protein [Myroides odoratimimus]MDM1517003.1 hypothetical protein [Myroides odoratimimus]MDM1536750.1 hypothetical protein [Myroides odoratimimus]MDM1676271.1 hypothetical protein [Myroides odoratimimus]
MKNILKSIIYMSFAGLIVSSCAKNDDFTTPNLQDCIQLDVNTTIAKLKSVTNTTIKKYEADDVLTGVVVSSDAGGSVFKELFVVSSDGEHSIRVRVDAYSTYASYGVGQEVYIKLKGLYTQEDPQRLITTIGADDKLAAIKESNINKYVIRACNKYVADDFNKTFNPVLSLEEAIDDKYIGKLVTMYDVQFKKEHRGKAFVEKGDFAKVYIESKKPVNKDVYFNVSKNAKGFAAVEVPNGSGTITGIMTRYVGGDKVVQYQFIPRTMDDLKLEGKVFEVEEVEEEVLPQHEIKLNGVLAWLGGDFKDFNAFMSTLEEYKGVKLKDYATEAKGKGWQDSNALSIKGKPTANDFVFTVENNKIPVDAESITFLLKGKAKGKSISINLYNEENKYDTAFNLKEVGAEDITLDKAIPNDKGYINDYSGSINTKGRWIKVTLNLKGAKFNTSGKGKFFGFKVGTDGDYDILVDEFRVVGGKDGGTDPVDPEVPSGDKVIVADFNNWDVFKATTGTFGIKYGVQAKGQGRDGKDAMLVKDTPKGNDFLFTVSDKAVPAGKTKMVVWVKGTAAKTLSFNVYKDAKAYDVFNAGVITKDDILLKAANNQYTGAIDTNGKWVKLTLDLTSMDGVYNSTGKNNVYGIKVGKEAEYDILIDSIYFE